MLFFKKRRTEEKSSSSNETESKPLADAWADKEISADELLSKTAVRFLFWATNYYDSLCQIEERIRSHNSSNEKYKKIIKRIADGIEYKEKKMDILLLEYHKNDLNDIKTILHNRNSVEIPGGYIELKCLSQCELLRADDTLDISKENFLRYCCKESVVMNAAAEIVDVQQRTILSNLGYEQLSLFYDVCNEYLCLTEKEEHEKQVSVSCMFDDQGLVMLPSADGIYRVVDHDFYSDYEELNYRGIV